MKNFLLVDDHKVVRMGLSLLLNEYFKPCMVYEAENKTEIEEKLQNLFYDLVILDLNIPGVNTSELLKTMLSIRPDLKVLVFSMNSEEMYAKRYLDLGAMGYVAKGASGDEIQEAITKVLANQKYYSEALINTMMTKKVSGIPNGFESLSPRESEILDMILEGKSLTEISSLLSISPSTTGTHKAKIFEKLKVENLVQLVELVKSKMS